MRRFIKKILLLLLIAVVIDRSFIIFKYHEDNVFADIANQKMAKVKTAFDSDTIFPIIILGSSHAQFGVSPEIISKKAGQAAINLAYGDGANIGKQLSLVKYLLSENRKHHPSTILLGLDVFALNNDPVYEDPFQDILFGHKTIMGQVAASTLSKSYINLYGHSVFRYATDIRNGKIRPPYFRKENPYMLSMFRQYRGYTISNLGWVMGDGILNRSYIRYANLNFIPSKKAIGDLWELIRLCKKAGVRLVFFQIPEHASSLQYQQKYIDFQSFMEQLRVKDNIEYFNLNNPVSFPVAEDSLFFDSDHLNARGAVSFSERLASVVFPPR